MNHDIKFTKGPVMITEGCGSEPYHMHRNAQELIWVLEGEAGITFNNVEYLMDSGNDLILIVDEDFHKIRKISSSLRYISFYIDLPYFQKYIKDILQVGLYVNPGYRPLGQLPYLKKMRTLLAQIIREYRNDESSPKVISLANSLLLLIRNHFNFLGTTTIDYEDYHTFNRLFGVYDFVYQHYTERITLADLAEHVHVSQAYLSRSIKQITGMGFIDILNYVRCEEALRQLLGTDKSITGIAYDCGFSDPKYFHRYFDKFFHANPVEFRRKHRAEISHYTLQSYQKKLNFDDSLTGIMAPYWEEETLTENQVSRIPFLSKDMGEVQRGGLTVFISSEDFIGQKLWGRLMSGLEADFGAIHIIHGEEQEAGQRHSEHSISLAESLEDAVHDNQVFLFARAGGWNGLYTEDGIKSPLYYILEQWIHAEGRREYGGGWAACRACQDGNDSMTLLAWNTSEEQISEFQILFEDKISEYLVFEYEFLKNALHLAEQLSASRELTMGCWQKHKAIESLCRPNCIGQNRSIGPEGLKIKLEPGQAGILLVTKLNTQI